MNENTAKNLAVASLVLGCIVYIFTLAISMIFMSDLFNNFNAADPTDMGNTFQRYFESMNKFRVPVVGICSAGILTGLGGLRAPKKQKGMAIAGLIMGVVYMITNLILNNVYARLFENLNL